MTKKNDTPMAESGLPDLHRQAFFIKNRKRLQHDGGRAWIMDGQLHDAVEGANYRIERGRPLSDRLKDTGRDVLEKKAAGLIRDTDSFRKI
ncbi:hypothetical protein QA596_07620 [Balneolales bacterium ANBcel1]|nr:hypothetical protein [Balneolales bacterium ANBcel1]